MYWMAIPIVLICVSGVYNIVKISVKHHENITRIRHGYPTLEGATKQENGYIDMTEPKSDRIQ